MKIKKSDLDKIIREEFDLMNGNGSAFGLPSNWASKAMPEFEVELEEDHEAGIEALQELGMFLAKLTNDGYNELAEDLDQILGKIRGAGLLAEHPDAIQEGLDETQWGGFGGSKRVAPLDTYADPNEQKPMSYEEQLQIFEMMVERGDRDPHEVLNYPQHFQNDLDFPDLQDDDVEDILSKLGLPEMNDPKWQRHTIGQKAVREGFWNKKKEAPNPHGSYADVLENAVKVMTKHTEAFPEDNGINYVIWGPFDDPFDRELMKLGQAFTKRLREVAAEHRAKEDAKDYKNENVIEALSKEFYNSFRARNNKGTTNK